MHAFTKPQSEVLLQLRDGFIIRKSGRGYALLTPEGRWIGKASIAVKSLALRGLIAKTATKDIYFTTHGYYVFTGKQPEGRAAELCAQADTTVEYVKSMLVE